MYYRKEDRAGLRIRLLGGTAAAALVVAFSSTLPSTGASAAGFALKEQSATAQGNSFAGATAGAEDISYMFFNPAGLVRHEGNQAAVALSYIAVSAQTNNAVAPFGGSTVQDGGASAVVPAAYLMWSLGSDLKLGLGINAPFGLKTEYDPTWAGRAHAIDTELKTINLNPVVAYRLSDKLSIGGGLQIQYGDVTLSSDTNPVGALAIGEVTADDWGFGATFGILVELSDATRLGLGYRSQIAHTAEGDFTISGAQIDTVSADLTTPDQVTAGVYHDLNEQFAVMAEVGWTNWSTFDEIRIVGDTIGLISLTPEDWENVWFGAVGVTWKQSENLAIRGGVAFDQSPIPDATRTPRIPGTDRTWVSLGLTYSTGPGFSIEAGYTHLFVDDSTVNLATLGTLTATFENTVDIIAVQGTLRF